MKSHIPLWLSLLGVAHAVPVQIDLSVSGGQATYNRLTVKIDPGSGMDDTKTSDLSGTLPATLDINPQTGTATVMTLSNGRLHGTNMTFSRSIPFLANYTINVSGMSARVETITPPGTVNPANGQFAANQHRFLIDQGSITGSTGGIVLGSNTINESFSPSSPATGTGTGNGTVTLVPTGDSGRFRNYNVTMIMDVGINDTFDASGTEVTVTGTGKVRATGTVQVPLGAANLVWTGQFSNNWETGGGENFTIGPSAGPFLVGDHVTFNNTATNRNVVLTGDLAPAAVTFDHTGTYTVTGAGRITGTTGLVKKGSGILTMGGDSNSFTGPVSIEGGILRIAEGNGGALGDNVGAILKTVTIASGAQFDVNGQALSGSGSFYHYHIAGAGPNGLGAITNSHAGNLNNQASGIRNLTLTANASIGGNAGRFDVGDGGALAGSGGTRVLTKVGSNRVGFLGPASGVEFVIEEGFAWAQNHNNAWGGSGGKLTIKNGARAGTWGARSIPTPVFIEDGGILYNEGGGTGNWSGAVSLVSGNATIDGSDGNAITITGPVTGAGNLVKTGANTLTLGGSGNTFTGSVSINAGILSLGANQGLGHASGITVSSGARLNLNGRRPGPGGAGRQYSVTIAGTGGSGNPGAITTTGTVNLSEGSGIQHLILSGDASIGATGTGNNARFDVGYDGSVASNDATVRTLTKVGTNRMGFRGPADNVRFVIDGGEAWAENDDNAWGDSLTIRNGARAGTYGDRTIATPVFIESGGILRNIGGGTSTWIGAVSLTGNVTVNSASDSSHTVITGPVTGTANLTKDSGNTLTIAQPGWIGNTTVSAGTLSLGAPTLAEDKTVTLAADAVLDLDFTGPNRVASLVIGTTSQPDGIYGSAYSHGDLFTGNGYLIVGDVPLPSGYGEWAVQITDENLRGFDDDADGDGLANGLEYVLGGDPNASGNQDILPALDFSGEEVEFVFHRNDDSTADTTLIVEYGGDLTWPHSIRIHPNPDPGVDVGDSVDGVSKITVTLPKLVPSLFARLKVTQ